MPSAVPITPLRLDPSLKRAAQAKAASAGLSLNAWLVGMVERELQGKGGARTLGASKNGPCPCGSGLKYKRCCGA